ncbi:MAG: DNA-binding protein [Clostridiales bacterium]|nr:DNA-binding protein [Clostridiales bacterium]
MAKNYEDAFLFDFYGDLLTEKQRNFLDYYYNDDLSLSEIAENEGITRQGVRDAIKRAQGQLEELESCLGLAQRFSDIKECVNRIIDFSDKITEYNLHHEISKELNDYSLEIKAAALTILES